MIFGVDIGGTSIKIGLFSNNGELMQKWSIPTNIENAGEYVISDAAKSIIDKVKEENIGIDGLYAIGVGVPCPVTKNGDIVSAANLGWNKEKNIIQELRTALGKYGDTLIYAANDANVAVLSEAFIGAAKGRDNVVMITLGTGVGGGIISNGHLIYGAHGMGGEIGHLHINDNETEKCGCGAKGCLEQISSATGIVRLTKDLLKEYQEPTILQPDNLTAKDVFDAFKKGDFIAKIAIDKFSMYLARALVNVSMLVDPDIFVIGGGVSAAGEILIDSIQKYYKEFMSFSLCDNNEFVLAKLGNDAGIVGAAKLALDGAKKEGKL